nr:immunoglobulin heavy chain junction region [Macaca mulatta]
CVGDAWGRGLDSW